MKEEISAAVLFISKLISGNVNLSQNMLSKFEERLKELLEERFSNHWHPERPWQGQGYRCLRVNENTRREPTIERAARDCGLKYKDLNLPVELTIWVDPEEVCCRFGEQKGSYCTVATFREGNKENFIETFDFSQLERPSSTPSGMLKTMEVLKERRFDGSNVQSPPSSTQSTPTKKKLFSPLYPGYGTKSQTSPSRVSGSGSSRDRKAFGNYHSHYSSGHLNHHHSHQHQSGSYSPPFYKTQSWLNLSQTPPPPHIPLLSSSGFIYPPTAPPHYTHAQMPPQFTRSPPSIAPQKFKWNTANYPRSDRHQWFGHRALARV
ncbi:protein BTG3 [Procambarus clarkii]|uniref:protein BTG3 n=1 Tax=Procambarus clarkii TaxID=6728 RepID=UPI001E6750FB|nr:protein BTG3-like [Procambarus clarkii]XP_045594705.1 protein BTG3-like [Procambarus clarkii]XP_045594706.1 protein BTG3-like [Procambarus clarkii]XP_045594707.1 protein BTG3-like [Procambarus clarkii]XP_045594708.1 protein BTG3-like [Procambarus clarkii]